MFSRAISFAENSTVLAAVWAAREGSEEASSRFSDCHSDIGAHLNIAKYSNIAGRIFENVEPSKGRDGSEGSREQRKEVLGGSPFLVTISSSAAQVPLS